MMNPHGKRWLTALVALPILVGLIVYGGLTVFLILIYLVLMAALREFFHIVLAPENLPARLLGFVAATLLYLAVSLGSPPLLNATVSMLVILVFLGFLWQAVRRSFDFSALALVLVGIFYIVFGFAHLTLLRQLPEGVTWVFFVLVLGFAGDTVGFYVGKTWGKRKLLPAVSPAKTSEGFLGLIAGSVLAVGIYQAAFLPTLPLGHALLLGFIGSIVGQLGDLCESAIKRGSGVKDSGTSLPGHGGILDRIDCLLFIVPFVYYYRLFFLA